MHQQSQDKLCLGEVMIPLTLYFLRRPQTRTFPLSEPKVKQAIVFMREKTKDNLGSLHITMHFVPKKDPDNVFMGSKNNSMSRRSGSKGDLSSSKSSQHHQNMSCTPRTLGTLEIRVIGAEGLPLRDSEKPPKPYCKVFLFCNQQNTSLGLSNGLKQTTPITNSTCDPQWNHHVHYHNLTLEILKDCCLEISVWDDFKRKKDEFIGGIRLSLIHSPSYDVVNGQQSISMSMDTNRQGNCQVFDSIEAESRIWDELVHGFKCKPVQGKIRLRNFTPYDKIRFNFGGNSLGHLFMSDSKVEIKC
jgi:hypothetical protein